MFLLRCLLNDPNISPTIYSLESMTCSLKPAHTMSNTFETRCNIMNDTISTQVSNVLVSTLVTVGAISLLDHVESDSFLELAQITVNLLEQVFGAGLASRNGA